MTHFCKSVSRKRGFESHCCETVYQKMGRSKFLPHRYAPCWRGTGAVEFDQRLGKCAHTCCGGQCRRDSALYLLDQVWHGLGTVSVNKLGSRPASRTQSLLIITKSDCYLIVLLRFATVAPSRCPLERQNPSACENSRSWDSVGLGLVSIIGDTGVRALVCTWEGDQSRRGSLGARPCHLKLVTARIELCSWVRVRRVEGEGLMANKVVPRG